MRLFVALEIPDAVKEQLRALAGGVPGAYWTEPENFHLTLRFIGEVEGGRAEEIDARLAEIVAPQFELSLAGLGQFATRGRPRSLWAGVDAPPTLPHLARKIDRAVVAAELPAEDRNFTPHVTLARLKDSPMERVMRFISEHGLFRTPAFTVQHFTLFESKLGNARPVYVPLADYPLEPEIAR